MLTYCLTRGDGLGWAIDEDARLLRHSLRGVAREVPAPFGRIVHSPFWVGLAHHCPRVLARRIVVAQADNPPFFYLTQPEFAMAQGVVHHWVARSREAHAQFEALGLRSTLIPYAIDERIFRRAEDREGLREALGFSPADYVVGNFHRDSEGWDLGCPKHQKAPEIFVWILKELRVAGVPAVALLAGPRRHWIMNRLREEGVPFVFAGQSPGSADDLRLNILPRERLAQLYTACDLYLITSRWEGGPQSVMEAAACQCKVVSSRVGVSLDLLDEECLFDEPREAVEKLARDHRENHLQAAVDGQFRRCLGSHSSSAMAAGVASLYSQLEPLASAGGWRRALAHELIEELGWRVRRRLPAARGQPAIIHEAGSCPDLDERMRALEAVREAVEVGGVVAGNAPRGAAADVQIAGPETSVFHNGAAVVAGSVQEALNFRARGCRNPLVVFPFPGGHSPDGEGPLEVAEGDDSAGPAIEAALEAGRAVVYPEDSPYRWQVFYEGVGYGERRSRSEAVAAARAAGAPRLRRPRPSLAGFLARLLQATKRRPSRT